MEDFVAKTAIQTIFLSSRTLHTLQMDQDHRHHHHHLLHLVDGLVQTVDAVQVEAHTHQKMFALQHAQQGTLLETHVQLRTKTFAEATALEVEKIALGHGHLMIQLSGHQTMLIADAM